MGPQIEAPKVEGARIASMPSGVGNGEGGEVVSSLQRGPGQSPGRQRIFGIHVFEVHRTLLVERTVLVN